MVFRQLFKMFLSSFNLNMNLWGCVPFFLPSQALGCSMEVPTISVCELLDQLINLFCFYNGSVRQSYQVQSAVASAVVLHIQSLICSLLQEGPLFVFVAQQSGNFGCSMGTVPVTPAVRILRASAHLQLRENH